MDRTIPLLVVGCLIGLCTAPASAASTPDGPFPACAYLATGSYLCVDPTCEFGCGFSCDLDLETCQLGVLVYHLDF